MKVFSASHSFYYLFFLLTIGSLNGYAQFPYKETFNGGTVGPKTIFGNSSVLTGDVLRLTNDQTFQKGYVYVDIPFSATYGLKTSFEYFDYGGTGADGMSFFLFDAAVTSSDFRIGSFGGSLGYAQWNSDPGLKGAYMGVGFDEYGNYGISSENKIGGIGSASTLLPNAVIVRGPESENYKFIDGKQTSPAPLSFPIGSGTSSRVTNSSLPGYRKVYIDLQPLAVGYNVVVKMDIGGVTGTQTILTTNYPYPAPASLKIGFAASSGGLTNYHEIDNVLIEVSDTTALKKPVAVNDFASMCNGEADVTLSILTNDTLKNNAPTYFDLTQIDLDTATAGVQSSFTILGQGTFTVNASGTVTFTKAAAFNNGFAEISYYVSDNYSKKSNAAIISVGVSNTPLLLVNSTLNGCQLVDLRTAITSSTVGLTLTYYKDDGSGNKILKTEAEIMNINSLANGIYYIKATNAAGCSIEKQVVVTVNTKPSAVVISLVP